MKKDNEFGKGNKEMFRCSICGKPITHEISHNAYPVRPQSWYGEKKNRCCSECNSQIILPIRIRLGREAGGEKYRKKLRNMNHDDLLYFIEINHLELHLPTMEEIIADMEQNGYKLDPKTGFWVAA